MPRGKMDVGDIDTILCNLSGNGAKKSNGQKFYIFSDKPEAKGLVIPFGDQSLDDASGIGGIMRGKLVELFGMESGGKSYLTLRLMAQAQLEYPDLYVGLVDVENSFSAKWAKDNGIDLDRLIFGDDFDHGEQALDYTKALIDSGKCSMVVLDSTAALIPKAELEASMSDHKMAEMGRMMSRSVKQIMKSSQTTNTATVFVNQIRSKVGMIFGNPDTTPGGRALKFYSHMRIDVRRIGIQKSKETGKAIGIISKAKFVKNKLAAPFETAEFSISFKPEGNHPIFKMVKIAHDVGLIRKKTDKTTKEVSHSWGKGKDAISVQAKDFISFGDWLVKQNKVIIFLEELVAKAKEEGVVVLDEVLALNNLTEFTSPLDSSEQNNNTEVSSGDNSQVDTEDVDGLLDTSNN